MFIGHDVFEAKRTSTWNLIKVDIISFIICWLFFLVGWSILCGVFYLGLYAFGITFAVPSYIFIPMVFATSHLTCLPFLSNGILENTFVNYYISGRKDDKAIGSLLNSAKTDVNTKLPLAFMQVASTTEDDEPSIIYGVRFKKMFPILMMHISDSGELQSAAWITSVLEKQNRISAFALAIDKDDANKYKEELLDVFNTTKHDILVYR